ncbi:MAG: RNA-directed DNA polymerase [Phycisphaerales bacterium]|nr:RNA-directed DNA polymerase [Phycisphaerales bacterium]NNM25929.1 RNA-directed DNA polymerase [Phycisphaerales bacterium]
MALSRFFRRGYDLDELARRLGVLRADLEGVERRYHAFEVRKRGGGTRKIFAPDATLKALQRRILRRLLALLVSHDAVHGFETGRSIVTNARVHAGRAVVIRLDIRQFFPSTTADRIERLFRHLGWKREAAHRLTELCTWSDGLPPGAPTSPRLANLVNYRMDTRLAGLASSLGAIYTRYADDLTFSLERDEPRRVGGLIGGTDAIVADHGYRLHRRRKLHIRRQHQQQLVTGLVVNGGVNLPRVTRRRLRAIDHALALGRGATLNAEQMEGWHALLAMVEQQRDGS